MRAVCPDETWDALFWATTVKECPAWLAGSPAGADNVKDFPYHVFIDVGAVVLFDEIHVMPLCGKPPIVD